MREKIPITSQLGHILPSNIGFHQPAVFCSMTSVISILPSVQYNYYPVVITKTNSDFRRRPKRFDKVKQRTDWSYPSTNTIHRYEFVCSESRYNKQNQNGWTTKTNEEMDRHVKNHMRSQESCQRQSCYLRNTEII